MANYLVVIDPQNDFISGVLGSENSILIADRIADKIKNTDGEIYVTLDTHGDDYLETTEGNYLPIVHCVENTHGWNLYPKIFNALKDRNPLYFTKHNFGSSELISEISSLSPDNTVTFVGYCTDICVLQNVILAKFSNPDLDVCVDTSCCVGSTPENHIAAIAILKANHINVIEE